MKCLFGSLLFCVVGICMPLQVHAEDPLTIYTINYPLQYFAQRIAGEHAQVISPGPADEDPAFWMPDTETIQRYQQADLILLNGAGYARWTKRVSLPRLRGIMIWEGQTASASVQRLKEMEIESLSYAPCANIPVSGDFMGVMRRNINNLKTVF